MSDTEDTRPHQAKWIDSIEHELEEAKAINDAHQRQNSELRAENTSIHELCKALLSAQAHCHSALQEDGHKELLDEIERLKRDIPMFNRQAH